MTSLKTRKTQRLISEKRVLIWRLSAEQQKEKGGDVNPSKMSTRGGEGGGWARFLLAEVGNKNWDEGGERMD